MSKFKSFMKKNKITKEEVMYPATISLLDENGKPLLWKLKPLTTKENESIKDICTKESPVKGKKHMYMPKLDISLYNLKMVCSAVVEPNLNDKELQDSYGVMSAEELLKEMIDSPGEYSDLVAYTQEISGFNQDLNAKIEDAKN